MSHLVTEVQVEAIHQHNKYPFSNPIANYYNKIELSNNPTSQNRASSTIELLTSDVFQEYLNMPLKKAGFFLERENKFIHATKE